MGSLILDIPVEYLIRATARALRKRGAENWTIAKGRVTKLECTRAVACPVAEVSYTYVFEGETYVGQHKKPFIFEASAERYVEFLSSGQDITVRVKLGEPSVSAILDDDQPGLGAVIRDTPLM